MFVVDAYLGNFDRHNGNWGILVNELTHSARLASVFDCGSCLYPAATDENLKYFLEAPDEMDKRIYEFPRTAIRVNGEKQLYHEFLLMTTDKDCLKAIAKIVLVINKKSFMIRDFIKNISVLSPVRKNFYNKILNMRREKILAPALERANKLLNIRKQTLSRCLGQGTGIVGSQASQMEKIGQAVADAAIQKVLQKVDPSGTLSTVQSNLQK